MAQTALSELLLAARRPQPLSWVGIAHAEVLVGARLAGVARLIMDGFFPGLAWIIARLRSSLGTNGVRRF
jgi:hypothetical protein